MDDKHGHRSRDLAAEVEAVGAESTTAVPNVEAVTVAIQAAGTEAETTAAQVRLDEARRYPVV